jgi:hypothetical protein
VKMLDRHFVNADLYVKHLMENPALIADAFVASRHVGFVAVSAVTVYELTVKQIFIEFGTKKHIVLGNFTKARFDRINGRIGYKIIWDDYVRLFGEKYVVRFKKAIAASEKIALRDRGVSIVASYNNIITWRHKFAHEGETPANVTLAEVVKSYEEGKNVLRCLAASMVR